MGDKAAAKPKPPAPKTAKAPARAKTTSPAPARDTPQPTQSRFVDESYTPQEIINKAKESYIALFPPAKGSIDKLSNEGLKDVFESALLTVNTCPTLKKLAFKDDLPTINATHGWNIMRGFLLLTGQKDDLETWGKIDYAYGKLMEMKSKLNYGLQNSIPPPAAGGALKIGDATKMFNDSLKRGDDTAVDRYNVKLTRLDAKVSEQLAYLERLYTTGTPKFSVDFEKRIETEVSRLEKEVDTLETEKYNFIQQVEDPSSKFKTLLDKFKTEAEFVSWIEKAKKEHIEAVSEARKTAQALKSVSTLKKSIDKCIEGMKKSLNGHCEKISKYSSLADKSKQLERKYQLILSLSAFMVDPGRGISNIRDVLEKLEIPSNGLNEYFADHTASYNTLNRQAYDLIRSIVTPGLLDTALPDITGQALTKLQEILDVFIKNRLLEKIPLIEPEMTVIRRLPETLKGVTFRNLSPRAIYGILIEYLREIETQDSLILRKVQIIASILDSASSAPAIDQIRKLRVQAQAKLTEINDDYAEIKEEGDSPIDVGKCLRDYKEGIAAIKVQNETEFDKIEKEEKESISKIAQDILKIRESTKVNITANIQAQGKGNQNYGDMTDEQLQSKKAAAETGLAEMRKKLADPAYDEKKKKNLPDQIRQTQQKIDEINREISRRRKANGGGFKHHKTIRNIKR